MKQKGEIGIVEVLVIIVVVVIVAVILLPAFLSTGHPPSRRTATLSNFKQHGIAAQLYLSDHNDHLPLAAGMNETIGVLRWNLLHRVPEGWQADGVHNSPQRMVEDAQVVLNSLEPYRKNLKLTEQNNIPVFQHPGVNYAQATKPRAKVGIAYNGFLHAWSATAIQNPSKLPIFAAMMMKNNLDGFGISSPQLCCPKKGTCRFNPKGPPGTAWDAKICGKQYGYAWWGVGPDERFTTWIYERGMHFAHADMNARFIRLNAATWPNYSANINVNPWSSFCGKPAHPACYGYPEDGTPGEPLWMTDCVAPGKGPAKPTNFFYAGYFRPDSTYAYTNECDFGQILGGATKVSQPSP